MPYDEETRRLIENRKRNAEYRKEQQMKKRKMTLAGLGAIIALMVVIIIIAASCSAKRDEEIETTPIKETSILGATTEVVSDNTDSTTMNSESSPKETTSPNNETATNETGEAESNTTSENSSAIKYTNDTVNIRRKASQDSEILEVLEEDEKVEVLGVEGEWSRVKWGDIEGYISSEYLKDK